VLAEVPEVLLVHLNRVGEQDTESGETEEFRIDSETNFSEEVTIKKEWLDPQLGGIRKDIKYVLSSVLLHQSETADGGPYTAVVKSQDGTWTLADDTKLSNYKTFEVMAEEKTIRENAYVFAYRRLPLVTRGPGITLKKSLQTAKYSDSEATEEIDIMEIDKAPTQTDGTMDIDAFGTVPVEPTKFGPLPNLPVESGKGVALPKLPTVVQQNDETKIELDEKQRGMLEMKFTTKNGVTTFKVHVKGMLWNDLKDKTQERASTGGRPVTRSTATAKQASNGVPPKPVESNPKAEIREKTSSSLVNGKKRQLEMTSPRSPGRIVKKATPKKSAEVNMREA
jgi:hypothetical protein